MMTSGIGKDDDVADLVRLGHLARDMALHRAAFVEAGVIGRHVGMVALVAGGMFELHIRELGFATAFVASMKPKEVVKMMLQPSKRHLGQHTLGIGTFRHVFLPYDLDLVTIGFLHGQRALVVLEGPAAITDRADIDEARLDLVLVPWRRRTRQLASIEGQGGSCQQIFLIERSFPAIGILQPMLLGRTARAATWRGGFPAQRSGTKGLTQASRGAIETLVRHTIGGNDNQGTRMVIDDRAAMSKVLRPGSAVRSGWI